MSFRIVFNICSAKDRMGELYQNLWLGMQNHVFNIFASKILIILCIFGTIYLWEQAFSVLNINKSKLPSQMTDGHLNYIMKVTTAQNLVPDVDKSVISRRCQISGNSNCKNSVLSLRQGDVFHLNWIVLLTNVLLELSYCKHCLFLM